MYHMYLIFNKEETKKCKNKNFYVGKNILETCDNFSNCINLKKQRHFVTLTFSVKFFFNFPLKQH